MNPIIPSNPSRKRAHPIVLSALAAGLIASHAASAEGPVNTFALQNISHNLTLTPPVFAVCPRDFAAPAPLGESASFALEQLAEGGETSYLITVFEDGGCTTATHDAPVGPGETIEIDLNGRRGHKVMVFSMALPTNDAFIGGPGIRVGQLARNGWVGLPAYDAGTELNDELCANIPGGAACAGEGFNADRNDVVDYVHPHPGITGGADLSAVNYEWTDPIARLRRVAP